MRPILLKRKRVLSCTKMTLGQLISQMVPEVRAFSTSLWATKSLSAINTSDPMERLVRAESQILKCLTTKVTDCSVTRTSKEIDALALYAKRPRKIGATCWPN